MIESIVAGIIAMAVATIGLLQARAKIELGTFSQSVKELRKEVEDCQRERRVLRSKLDQVLREMELSKFESRIKELEERLENKLTSAVHPSAAPSSSPPPEN